MGKRWKRIGMILAVIWTLGSALAHAQAEPRCEPWISKLVSFQGEVSARQPGDDQWRPAVLNQVFCTGDRIRVAGDSRAAFVLSNDAMLRIDQNSTLVFTGIEAKKSFWLELLEGAGHFFSRKARSLKIVTPFVNGVVKGTEFYARVDDEKTFLSLLAGRIQVENPQGSIELTQGQAAVARAGQPPRLETVVHPRDAVQWALYYPPIFSYDPKAFKEPAEGSWQARANQAAEDLARRDLTRALARLEDLPESPEDPHFYAFRASLKLAVGSVADARQDLAAALSLDANHSPALALRAVMAVVQNRKADALADAGRAVRSDPQSAAARIALSFAHQADFNLPAAHQAARAAVEAQPLNALAWARLAELRLSLGELAKATKAAQKAVDLDPNVARIQTTLGFAHLTQIKTGQARQAFTRAIALDSADPLPHLGLGIAQIRGGELKAGRAEIEIAAGLDPNNALIRAYLGKAYFDEKRGPLAARQLAVAKELDPNDPTPWLYDAVRRQTENRPGEALEDLQKSTELNDNRAVYRSRLLLDQDRAARGASLARIYDDLGFGQQARLQAARSLDSDPASHSAHRFLSDSYSRMPGHEIAQVSELLQSQLLQPININPVQPSLVETDLSIVGSGPAGAAFNEYTSLFERNRAQLLASGAWGNNGTWGDEAVVSGIYDRLSLSAGQFHYETDGYRPNNDLSHDIYNLFAQVAVNPRLNLQAEWRHRETERGDLILNFDPDDYFDARRLELERDEIRLGGRLSLSPRSDLIASVFYKDEEGAQLESATLPTSATLTVEETAKTDGYQAELQYIHRSDLFSAVAGTGILDLETDTVRIINLVPSPVPGMFPQTTSGATDSSHDSAYLYINYSGLRNFIWTVGLSYDNLEDDLTEREEWNPKFGFQWQVNKALRLRSVALRTVKQELIANQTLEPTQVAGFNQFFDDSTGTVAKGFGLGLDYRFSPRLQAGLEVKIRELEVPFIDLTVNTVRYQDWDETLYAAYLNFLVHPRWTLSCTPTFEDFQRNEGDNPDTDFIMAFIAKGTETLTIPFSIHWTDPSGFFSKVTATYVNQEVDLPASSTFNADQDNFTIVDLAAGFRLPRRLGMISLEVHNLFDSDFFYQDNNFRLATQKGPMYLPDRSILGRVALYF